MSDAAVRATDAAAPEGATDCRRCPGPSPTDVTRWPNAFSLGGAVVLSAGALALVQPPHGGGILGCVALCPWLWVLRGHRALVGATSGLAFGTLTGLVGIPWMPAGLERVGLAPGSAMLATLLLAVWASGVPWVVFGLTAAWARRLPPWPWCGLLAALALAMDSLRSGFAITFPWALLGHTQATVPGVAQLAALGGVPLISALVVLVNAAVACAIAARGETGHRRSDRRVLAAALGAYAALASLGLPLAVSLRGALEAPHAPALDVLVVQPNLHPRERWHPRIQRTNLAILAEQAARALEDHPAADLVVWPENTLTTPLESDPVLARELAERVDALGVPVVLGAVREGDSPEQTRTSALWVAPGRGIVDALDKTRAIPLIETAGGPAPIRGIEALLDLGAGRRLVAEGSEERPLQGAYELVPALCYEILFPGLVGRRRSEASAAIVNLGNDSWFLSAAPSGHQIAIASFRAIEQRLHVVRAVHGGASAVLDPFGRVVAALPFGHRGALAARIVPQPPPHPLERAGIGALALAGGGLGLFVSSTLSRRIVS